MLSTREHRRKAREFDAPFIRSGYHDLLPRLGDQPKAKVINRLRK